MNPRDSQNANKNDATNVIDLRASSEQPIVYNNWDHLHDSNSQQSNVNMVGSKNRKHSFFFKFFLVAVIILICAFLYAGVQYFMKSNSVSGEKINITTNLPDYTDPGSESTTTITITNDNKTPLENVVLRINYKKGINPNGDPDVVYKDFDIGSLIANSATSTDVSLVFFGQEGEVRTFNAELAYKVAGSNAVFAKSYTKNLTINAPLVTLNIDAFDTIIADHEFTVNIRVKNVGQEKFTPSILTIEVPAGFVIKRAASSTPGSGLTEFKLDNLALGAETSFKVTGYFKNALGQTKNFRGYVSAQKDGGTGASFATVQHQMIIVQEPVDVSYKLKVNNQDVNSATNGVPVDVAMIVNNSSENAIDNISVLIKTNTGESFKFDEKTNQTDGLLRLTPNAKQDIYFTLTKLVTPKTIMSIEIYGKMRGSLDTVLLKKADLPIAVQ